MFSTTSLVVDRAAVFQCCPLAAIHPRCTVSCCMHVWLCRGCLPKDVLCLNWLNLRWSINMYYHALTVDVAIRMYVHAHPCTIGGWACLVTDRWNEHYCGAMRTFVATSCRLHVHQRSYMLVLYQKCLINKIKPIVSTILGLGQIYFPCKATFAERIVNASIGRLKGTPK